MKTPTKLLAWFALVVATSASAALESLSVDVTRTPQMPASLLIRGVNEAKVIVVINVNHQGVLTDHLVIGFTHESLVRPVVEALPVWQYKPAKLDGVPVPTQIVLTINFDQTGAVVSYIGNELMDSFTERLMGTPLVYRPSRAREIDQTPVLLNTVKPKYALEAKNQGVRGKVQVHFYIDENGAARMPAVDNSDHPYLSEIAVAAVREWKFTPTTSAGKPALVEVSQEFHFGDS